MANSLHERDKSRSGSARSHKRAASKHRRISSRREDAIPVADVTHRRLGQYELYTTGPDGVISNRGRDYRSGMWVAKIRAASIRHAYHLLAHQIGAPGGRNSRGAGIILLDSSAGPSWGWPWDLQMSKYGPKNWSTPRTPKGWPKRYDEIVALERQAMHSARKRLGLTDGPFLSGSDLVRLSPAIEEEIHAILQSRAEE